MEAVLLQAYDSVRRDTRARPWASPVRLPLPSHPTAVFRSSGRHDNDQDCRGWVGWRLLCREVAVGEMCVGIGWSSRGGWPVGSREDVIHLL